MISYRKKTEFLSTSQSLLIKPSLHNKFIKNAFMVSTQITSQVAVTLIHNCNNTTNITAELHGLCLMLFLNHYEKQRSLKYFCIKCTFSNQKYTHSSSWCHYSPIFDSQEFLVHSASHKLGQLKTFGFRRCCSPLNHSCML